MRKRDTERLRKKAAEILERDHKLLAEHSSKPILSKCGRFEMRNRGTIPHIDIRLSADGTACDVTYWRNDCHGSRYACSVGIDGKKDLIQFDCPRHPSGSYRRWVLCLGPDICEVVVALAKRGIRVLSAYKPGLNCYIHLLLKDGMREADRYLNSLKDQSGKRLEWTGRRPRAGWDI